MHTLLPELSRFYSAHARGHLPWRTTRDPYKILVSEVMLQQTQVDRVLPKYREFMRAFPTLASLAKAPLSQVLFHWQGLGYNRRAKFLHEAAKMIIAAGGTFPQSPEALEDLPGVGRYTARAVAVFAFNTPEVFIETNIRTVFTHYYFSDHSGTVGDNELLPLIAKDLKRSKMEPREFYAALMDYGSHLKRQGIRINNRSRHYTKQSKFEGSLRQVRGAILRELITKAHTEVSLTKALSISRARIRTALESLAKEKLIELRGKQFSLHP